MAGWQGWVQTATSSGSDLLSSAANIIANKQANKKNQDFAADQARIQREFEERMSSTAHQREVTDLRAAGLNPILSAKYGGASTPPVGIAQATVEPVTKNASLGSSASRALENFLTAELIKTEQAKQKNLTSSAAEAKALADKTNAETPFRNRVNDIKNKSLVGRFLLAPLTALAEALGFHSAAAVGANLTPAIPTERRR